MMAKFLQGLFKFEAVLASTCYACVALALILDVASRELFSHSIFGIQRIAVFMVIATSYMGMGLAAGQNKHLRPRFADNWLPPTWQPYIARISDLVSALLFFSMGMVCLELVLTTYQWQDQASMINIPLWTIQWVMPYGFFSTALRYGAFSMSPDLKPQEAGAEA